LVFARRDLEPRTVAGICHQTRDAFCPFDLATQKTYTRHGGPTLSGQSRPVAKVQQRGLVPGAPIGRRLTWLALHQLEQ